MIVPFRLHADQVNSQDLVGQFTFFSFIGALTYLARWVPVS